jgi:hypothetical protein
MHHSSSQSSLCRVAIKYRGVNEHPISSLQRKDDLFFYYLPNNNTGNGGRDIFVCGDGEDDDTVTDYNEEEGDIATPDCENV